MENNNAKKEVNYKEMKGEKDMFSTDILTTKTVPIIQARIDDIEDVMVHPWDPYWDDMALDENTPIIIEKRRNIILAGHYQLYKAKLAHKKVIPAVYIDLLENVDLKFLKEQFNNDSIYLSFAYNIHACLSSGDNLISFSDFCKDIYYYHLGQDLNKRIRKYIDLLNFLIGVPADGK